MDYRFRYRTRYEIVGTVRVPGTVMYDGAVELTAVVESYRYGCPLLSTPHEFYPVSFLQAPRTSTCTPVVT